MNQEESRTKWLPVSEFDSRTLQTLARNIDAAISNIQREGTRTSNQTSTSAVYRKAWQALLERRVERKINAFHLITPWMGYALVAREQGLAMEDIVRALEVV